MVTGSADAGALPAAPATIAGAIPAATATAARTPRLRRTCLEIRGMCSPFDRHPPRGCACWEENRTPASGVSIVIDNVIDDVIDDVL
jgi:hypothetical protein